MLDPYFNSCLLVSIVIAIEFVIALLYCVVVYRLAICILFSFSFFTYSEQRIRLSLLYHDWPCTLESQMRLAIQRPT